MPRELLHVSLGHEACHVSAHYLNLAGLSVTDGSTQQQHDDDEGNNSTCDPEITHTASYRSIWTPRVLMVDGPINAESGPVEHNNSSSSSVLTAPLRNVTPAIISPADELNNSNILNSALWNGAVEQIDLGRNDHHSLVYSVDPRVAAFRETAAQASTASFSRYRAPVRGPATASNFSLASSNNSNQRAVDWDNMSDEEEEEEDEYAEEERRKRLEREEYQWKHSVYPQMQDQMDSFWEGVLPHDKQKILDSDQSLTADQAATAVPENAALDVPTKQQTNDVVLHWKDNWMPPYQPSSILDLPNAGGEFWDYYYPLSQLDASVVPQAVREWIQDDFLDGRIRRMLEDMDSCQGVTICQSGTCGGALTTLLLDYLQEDCPGARRWLWSLQESSTFQKESEARTDASWRTKRVQHVRQEIQKGLQWHDTMEYAHATLLLKGRALADEPRFAWSAKTAAALETATLAYRLSASKKKSASSRIGLNSYYYGNYSPQESPFGSADSMNLAEFLTTLVPAPGLSILELDTLLPSLDKDKLTQRFLVGTSLERDQRMKSGGSRPREELPGSWMMDSAKGGLLNSLSHTETDRSSHTHFAMAGSLRLGHSAKPLTTMPTTASTSSQYVDCLLQGMGLRYRPEQSLAVQLNQTLSTLTSSQGYGAGSYWKHVFSEFTDKPILSVLGNTTRFHATASPMAASVKEAIYAPRNKGFLNRDISQGILPEEDDCHEILSALCNLCDRYQPSGGYDDIENDM